MSLGYLRPSIAQIAFPSFIRSLLMSLVKLCVLFRPDGETELLLDHIREKLGCPRSEGEKKVELPHHMTIIGGGVVEEDSLKPVLEMLTSVIRPFSEGEVPEVSDMEACFLPSDIGIRFKFPKGGSGRYVITGDRSHNQRLLSVLRTRYSFDGLPRHVSLLPLPETGKRERYRVIDESGPQLAELLETHKDRLLRMTLAPEIWAKRPSQGLWQGYVQ
jgi:hypothetical protein